MALYTGVLDRNGWLTPKDFTNAAVAKHPPQSASQAPPPAKPKASPLRSGSDPLELQREAKELLELSQSLQPDMESLNHGLLPKDTIDKLKRIEKLSKRLRGELAK